MSKADWFKECGWGVFCHYLSQSAGGVQTEGEPEPMTAERWNVRVDAFDVNGLRDQLVSVGARYFFITLGQGTAFLCAPNKAFDRLTGISPSPCARRDLIADLYEALAPHGIRLLLYSAADLANKDSQARAGLKLEHHHNDGEKTNYAVWREYPQIEFKRNMEAIHEEWSKRWGNKIAGWWIDGCYEHEVRFPEGNPPNLETLAAALRAGNPDAIVAFNTGVKTPIILNSRHEDYAAGEVSRALPQVRSSTVEIDGYQAQYHLLSFLGANWGNGSPRFPDDMVAGYTQHVIEHGGVMTWDVPIQHNGLIPQEYVDQLKVIGRRVAY